MPFARISAGIRVHGLALVLAVLTVSSGFAQQNQLVVSPTTLNFSSTGTLTGSIAVSTPTSFTVEIRYTSVTGWLTVTPTSGSTSATLTATASVTGLVAGTYSADVIVTAPGTTPGTTQQRATRINLTVTGGSGGTNPSSPFTVSPTSLSFTSPAGSGNPISQFVSVNASGGQVLQYTATASTDNNIGWLLVSPSQAATPSSVSVSVERSLLTSGTYTGRVTITPTGGAPTQAQTIAVTFTVNAGSGTNTITPNPASVTFANYGPGSTTYPPDIAVTLSAATTLNYSAAITTITGNNWLQIRGLQGTTTATSPVTGTITAAQPAVLNFGFFTDQLRLLPAGTYTATVQITAPGTNLAIPVTLNVGSTGGAGVLSATPAQLNFTTPAGGADVTQTVSLSSLTTVSETFTALSNQSWLSVVPLFGSTPETLEITVSPAALPSGQTSYVGTITVTPTSSFAGTVTIPVTVTIGVATPPTATPPQLTFTQVAGGAAPAAQTIQVATGTTPTGFTASTTASYVTVTPTSGNTPAALTVSVTGAGLQPGTYNAAINIVVSGAATPLAIPVAFTVTSASALSANPSTLTFNHQLGSTAPPGAQTISVAGSTAPLSFTAVAATATGGSWLAVSPASGTTPANISAAVNTAGLAPGVYSGSITVTGAGASNAPQVVTVTLNVTQVTATVQAVVNAASFTPTAVAAGQIVTLRGVNLGPTTGVSGQINAAGLLETALGGTRVLFDNIPAPLLFVRNDQINLVAPYALFGRLSSRLVVETMGAASPSIELRVVEAALGIFSADSTGRGQGAILNQNNTLNSASNPADRGAVVVIYGSGEGQTTPAGNDGRIVTPADLRRPLLPLRVFIAGQEAEVLYAGSAPGFVAGTLQVNVRLPANLQVPPGVSPSALPIELQAGGVPSPGGITLAVRP